MTRAVEVFAPAKVNLRLEVLGRRPDGFHDLATWMVALDFGDTLRLGVAGSESTGSETTGAEGAARAHPPGDIALEVDGPFASPDIPTDDRNLVVRALDACRARAHELGHRPALHGLRCRLTKHVPSQSGLGGASSDAAAALEAFESLFDLDLGDAWRRATLARLGSDCVFFEGTRKHAVAFCEGRGERTTPFEGPAPDWTFAVVTPGAHCPTPEVFRALAFPLSPPPQAPMVQRDMFVARARDARRWSFNHLEQAAAEAFPEVRRWRSILDSSGAESFVLSGSGSSFFGLFDGRDDAAAALERIRTEALRQDIEVRGTWVARAHRRD